MNSDALKPLLNDLELVACRLRGDEWPRRQVVPAGWWGLVLAPDGTQRLAPAGADPKLAAAEALLLVRDAPQTVTLGVSQVPSADGHAVDALIELTVRWSGDELRLAALGRTLSGESLLRRPRLTSLMVEGGAMAGLREFVRATPAAELVHGDARQALQTALAGHLQRLLFESGLTLVAVAAQRCTSRSLTEQEVLERDTASRVARLRAEVQVEAHAREAQDKRLERLATLLDRLKGLAGQSELRWHALLGTLSPPERAQLLGDLWRITPNQTVAESIVVVAGHECLWLDPAAPERVQRRVRLPGDLGALRSVRYCAADNTLLVGAGWGVWRIAAGDGTTLGRFVVPTDARPETGFNAAVQAEHALIATHSRLGCWCWPLAGAGAPVPVLTPTSGTPRAIRAVTALGDGRVVFAADADVLAYRPGDERPTSLGRARDEVRSLAVLDEHVYAGTAGGQLLRLDVRLPGTWVCVHRVSGAVDSVQVRRWDDLVELVIPAGADGVSAIYGDEATIGRLLDPVDVVRRAWACDDVVVALTESRDRLLVLNSHLPGRVPCEAPVARLVGHRVQDACVVTRTEAPAAAPNVAAGLPPGRDAAEAPTLAGDAPNTPAAVVDVTTAPAPTDDPAIAPALARDVVDPPASARDATAAPASGGDASSTPPPATS